MFPQSLPSLSDVNINLNPTVGQVLKFDGTVWDAANDSNGIPDAPDASSYVWSNGVWNLLSGTTEITTLSTDLGTA